MHEERIDSIGKYLLIKDEILLEKEEIGLVIEKNDWSKNLKGYTDWEQIDWIEDFWNDLNSRTNILS